MAISLTCDCIEGKPRLNIRFDNEGHLIITCLECGELRRFAKEVDDE